MRRFLRVSMLLSASFALAFAATPGSTVKGTRAVIVHGTGMPEILRFGDIQQATALHNSFVRVLMRGEQGLERATFANRPCLGFAAYSMKWEYSLAEGLGPEDADWKYYFYPAFAGLPPTLFNGAIVPDSVARAWADLGIPMTATQAMKAPCAFHR